METSTQRERVQQRSRRRLLPLTRRAKLLMTAESAVSAITALLVAARSVDIFR